jgi:hypothetical protein
MEVKKGQRERKKELNARNEKTKNKRNTNRIFGE